MKGMLLAGLLCLAGGAMGQEPEAVKSETVIPDAGPSGTDQQIQANTARIEVQEKMSGNQDFILKLLGIIVPAIVLMMQWRLSKQVNGMKDQLVEEVRKAALLQGAKSERQARSHRTATRRTTKAKPARGR